MDTRLSKGLLPDGGPRNQIVGLYLVDGPNNKRTAWRWIKVSAG